MWAGVETIGVIGPRDRVTLLRRPTMREFRDVVTAAGLAEPRSWMVLYEVCFGESAPSERAD
jgi:hypothetical protein